MLDPLTALGVASNVLALIDFSGKLVSGAISIYGSIEGATKDNLDIESVAIDLSEMSGKLSQDIDVMTRMNHITAHLTRTTSSVHQDALYKLTLRCKQLAEDLLQTLQKFKIKSGKYKMFKSGVAAIKISMKADDIARYKRTLDDIRSQMTARMVSLISEHQREMFDILRRQSEDKGRSDSLIKASTDNLESSMASVIAMLSVAPSKADFAQLLGKISELIGEWKHTTSLLKTINSLSFDSIDARWVAVEAAYSKTFEWAFQDNVDSTAEIPSLGKWLESGSNVFWVTGKPGSGKSTFMKYVYMEEKTEQLLKLWSGQHELIRASHFFWAAGTPMQRSLAGLLQSLLSDLLTKCPKLAEVIISKDRLEAPVLNRAPWTISELRVCFSNLKKQNVVNARICFFVDGLDEYDGDHEQVLEIFEDLAKDDNIKFCLASRDWNVFRDWFKECPMFRLEALTRADIRHFTQSKLEEDRRFAILRKENITYVEVITLIVDEAEGVFLWVYLVVQSLKRGFIEGDTIKDLMRRIKALPKKLDEFFLNMLDSVEEVYHVQSAEILQVCQAHLEAHLPLISASFFDEEDFLFGTNLRAEKRLDADDILSRCISTERRVRARCRDLVMFKQGGTADRWYIEFVHRSAKDFVQSEHVQKLLTTRARKNFSPFQYLCQATIAEARLMPRTDRKRGTLNEFEVYTIRAFQYAELYEKSVAKGNMQSMNWLDEMNSTLEAERFQGPELPREDERAKAAQGIRNTWLFNNALRHSGFLYLKHCIEPFADTEKWTLKLGPRLVSNLSQGSVIKNDIKLLESAFFLLSLGSMKGETIVNFTGNSTWPSACDGESLCFCILHPFAEDKTWVKNETFYQLARQFIDEVLRRTETSKLKPRSYIKVEGFCSTMRDQYHVSSAGIDSFLRNADLMYTAEKEAIRVENQERRIYRVFNDWIPMLESSVEDDFDDDDSTSENSSKVTSEMSHSEEPRPTIVPITRSRRFYRPGYKIYLSEEEETDTEVMGESHSD